MTREKIRQIIDGLGYIQADVCGMEESDVSDVARDALTLLRVMVGSNLGGGLPGTDGTITEWLTSSEYVQRAFEDIDNKRKAASGNG